MVVTSPLYLSSLIQISISHLYPLLISLLLVHEDETLVFFYLSPFSLGYLSLYIPQRVFQLSGTCSDKHTANTLDKSAPVLLLSISRSLLLPGSGRGAGAIFVSRFVCRFISHDRDLSRFVTSRFISLPLSLSLSRSGENIRFLDISPPASNSYT